MIKKHPEIDYTHYIDNYKVKNDKNSEEIIYYYAKCYHCGWSIDFPKDLQALNNILNYEHWLIKDGMLFCPECRKVVRDNLYRKIFGYGPKEFVINSIVALIMIVAAIISIIYGFIWITIISIVLGLISLFQIILLFFRYFLRTLDNMMFYRKDPWGLTGKDIKNKID